MLSVFCNAQSEVEKKSTDDEKKPTLIQLIQADVANNHRSTNNQILIGNVIFKHDEAFLYCDSAYLNKSRNDLEAFGKVHVIESDTINLYGKHLIYNGNTKLAEISREVLLTDPTTNLRTEILFYDRAKQVAYYNTGATIINSDKTLVSKRGIYNLDNKDFDFFIDVVITDPEYVLEADTVFYNSNTEIARTISKTIIHNGENTIYCEKGIYDSKVKKSFLKTNVEIHYNEYIVFCDSAYYNESIEYAEAYKDVITIDTANNVKSWSEYLEYNKIGEYAFISEDAVARAVNEGDTIFLFADTLFAKFNNETETIDKAFAYNNTKIFSNDYQSACDSLVYYHSDSIAVLYNSPALWSGNNQITGDSITFIVKNETLEKITATPNGFIISEDSLGAYNQIKGKLIDLFFENNKLDNVFVNGNSEILYFLREDDGTMIGPYYIISSDSRIFFNENEISKLINLSNPKSELTPEEKSVKEKEILTGFKNKFDEIPEKPTNNKFFR
ncbi:hypothetical protein LJC25_01830 [Bacteroidales bacterium OttesenSCG-928-K03]|nr:hypothetical protein [Odoribacter sp. OttesenSCG-928-L07]MDL2239734.1 hypothetical protein [Bacteroidales bacterium OttesenSCG-928-L14]MDL2242448.1 hypothetical protein [Bacteroidales bacterium OttesenSCG-928-K03]